MAKRKQSDPSEPVVCPFTIIIDNSEQLPWQFQGMRTDEPRSRSHLVRPLLVPTVWRSINTGDYSIEGFENYVTIERKSHVDAAATFTRDRERFERELERMQDIAQQPGSIEDNAPHGFAAVVIEAEWSTILAKTCPACHGTGFTIPPGETISIQHVTPEMIASIASQPLAELLRQAALGFKNRVECQTCSGSGKVAPLEHSKASPKSLFRSVIAWQHRYPNIQWWAMPGRRAAELTCFRLLERFWGRVRSLQDQRTKQASERQLTVPAASH